MTQLVSDCLRTFRLAISRRNAIDPDSSDSVLLQYLNNFISLSMSNDVRLFENFDTLIFEIDQTNPTGVYTLNDVGASSDFSTISNEAFISLTDPPMNSVSWNKLFIVQDPGLFFFNWGINNANVLIPGYPTEMLFYGNTFTFRTIPNTSYTVNVYGYKIIDSLTSEGDPAIPFDYWMRYLAYGAASEYASDFNFDEQHSAKIQKQFSRQRNLILGRTHNQIKQFRAYPRF